MHWHTLRTAGLAVLVGAGLVTAGADPALAAAPTIGSFSPASGTIGTTVTSPGRGSPAPPR